MSRKLSVDLELSTQGYVASIKEAKNATADYTTGVRVSNDILKQMTREVKQAEREAVGLALTFNKLSDAEKNGVGGQAMQRQISEAIQGAAKLKDISQDVRDEIKAQASDTAGWDAAKQGIDILKSATLSYAGVVAKLTGNEEGLKNVIAKLTIIENGFNTAIKIGNAFQRQSALMSQLRRLGIVKTTTAITAQTAAVSAEATATKGAAVAQTTFNKAAWKNPYVILAAAAVAAVAAIGIFTYKTMQQAKAADEAAEKQKKFTAAMDEVGKTAAQSASSELVKIDLVFRKLNDENVSRAEKLRLAKALKSIYPTVLADLSAEEIATGKTADAYDRLTSSIMAAATARAAEDKLVEVKTKEIELNKKRLDQEQKEKDLKDKLAKQDLAAEKRQIAAQNRRNVTSGGGGGGQFAAAGNAASLQEQAQNKVNAELQQTQKELAKTKQEITDNKAEQEQWQKAIIASRGEANGLVEDLKETKGGSGSSTVSVDTKYAKDSLTELENKLSDLQRKYKDGLRPDLDKDSYLKEVDDLETAIEAKKINMGLTIPPNEIQQIDKKIEDLKKKQLDIKTRLSSEQFQAELKKLEDEKHEINVKCGFEIEPSEFEKLQKNITEKLKAYTIDVPIDVDAEPSELDKKKKELEQLLYLKEHVSLSEEELEQIKKKIKDLKDGIEQEEIHLDIKAPKTVIDKKQDVIDELTKKANAIYDANGGMPEPNTDAYQQLLEIFKQIRDTQAEINTLQQPLAAAEEKHNKALEKRNKTMNGVSKAIGDIGSAMASLADEEDKGTQAAAIIVQAIANVIAGYASASAEAGGTLGPWGWAAFSIAGLAQVAATIAQLKSLSSGYAAGGFIPGTSFSGDRLLARVNSGEAVLNTQQQKRFMDIANGIYGPGVAGPQQVVVTGEIDGTKLLLVQRNTNKVRNKSGNAITF